MDGDLDSEVALTFGRLIEREAAGGLAGDPLTQRDLVGEIAFADTGGKVVLVSDSHPVGCNGSPTTCTPTALDKIVDLVGYGNATYREGLANAVSAPSDRALARVRNGCTDINNNGVSATFPDVPADLILAHASPRSSTSTPSFCDSPVPVPASPVVWTLTNAVYTKHAGFRLGKLSNDSPWFT